MQKIHAANFLNIFHTRFLIIYLKALKSSSEVGNALHAIEQWSQNGNLVFNAKKTKSVLFSICKMSQHH